MVGGLQGELFKKSQYGVATCLKCRAVGTIVEMGRCCLVQQLSALDSAALSESGGSLSSMTRNLSSKKESCK
jgi:hypothetical protein